MAAVHGFAGWACLLIFAFAFSENRRAIPVRIVAAGVALQFALAVLFLKFPPASAAISILAKAVGALDKATEAGTSFVFGYLGGAPLPFQTLPNVSSFVPAVQVFPVALVICALSSLLFYWGVMQKIVGAMAFVLRRTVGVSGSLGLGAAVNVFVGMVEAPLLVRPYLATMARGELFALMSCGMAGIAGTVMVIYGRILGPVIPDSFRNILTAALISAPAAIAVSAILLPFPPRAEEDVKILVDDPPLSAMEAITRGTTDGVAILASIIAHLIVLLALVALVDMALGALPNVAGTPITLQRLFALAFRPVAFIIGIDSADLDTAAQLLGTKTVLNEFVAYMKLAALPPNALSPHSRLILTYAMCGFANFGSVGIMVGGLCAMAPQRKHDVVALAFKAMFCGTLATLMGGALVGALT